MKNILIIGSGGREHALAWKAAQSELVTKIFVAPGNAGTASEHKTENVAINVDDIDGLLQFAKESKIDLTIVGPEGPLVAGIVDRFENAGLRCFGPKQAAAQLEGSKTFSKDFFSKYKIPTAHYQSFTDVDEAVAYLVEQQLPIVIKADGLAAGKGVIIAHTQAKAIAAVTNMLADNRFGEAGQRIVIEEFLEGEEASFIVLVDGNHALPLATSQDHKARDDGDRGPNTGGMGAYSPAPVITPEISQRIMDQIILPTVNGMREEGCPYTGFLYAGLMIDDEGHAKVLEFNCRFGDPETQPIMIRLQSDLIELIEACIDGRLSTMKPQWDSRVALGVVMASQGYPESYPKGEVILGLESINDPNVKVFHAGTSQQDNKYTAIGGRVLCVTALDQTTTLAQQRAYHSVKKINWDHAFYRTDIGYRSIIRETQQNKNDVEQAV